MPNCFHIPPYLPSLLKRCRIPEKPVYSTLLNSLLPFFLSAFCLKPALTLFFFEFGLPLNTPLIVLQLVLAILNLGVRIKVGPLPRECLSPSVHNFADSERRKHKRITPDIYAQARMPNKRLAQSKLLRKVLHKRQALAQLDHDAKCQFLASA